MLQFIVTDSKINSFRMMSLILSQFLLNYHQFKQLVLLQIDLTFHGEQFFQVKTTQNNRVVHEVEHER